MHPAYSITIENNDGKIWHRDQVLLDLITMAIAGKNISISLNHEGACAHSLGLYAILDDICYRTGLDKNKIVINTCNLLECHNEYEINIFPPTKHIFELQQQINNNLFQTKTVDNIKKHFGHFIGHSSRHRLAIGSWLFTKHKNITTQTFHSTPTHKLHREFLGLEDLWFNKYEPQHIDRAIEFLKQVPLTYDPVPDGPILHFKMYEILDAYSDIFLDIVCNTYISGNTFYMDEKIWRPIITKTPFIVHGPKNFIKNFRKLGFKTFDQWWDEGFSEDHADDQTRSIINIIDQISKYSLEDLQKIYHDMKPTLDYNYDLFRSITPAFFKKEFERG
jgi:hypothetical protein